VRAAGVGGERRLRRHNPNRRGRPTTAIPFFSIRPMPLPRSMPNGRIHDHPFTDLIVYGLHPFPADIEKLVLEIRRHDPYGVVEFGQDAFDWERGQHLDDARRRLGQKLEDLRSKTLKK